MTDTLEQDIFQGLSHGPNTYQGYKIDIIQDDLAESPRDWDNLGTMVCWHNRYNLGDEQPSESPDDYYADVLKPIIDKGGVVLPLYLYDHSGLSMNTGGFSCPWDSGQVGYIYATAEKIREEYGFQRITKQRRKDIAGFLRNEVSTYDQYLGGDVYGYSIDDAQGEHIDSCWGYFGFDACAIAAAESLAYHIEQQHKAHINQVKAWIRHRVPLELRG